MQEAVLALIGSALRGREACDSICLRMLALPRCGDLPLTLDAKGFKIRPPSESGAPTKDAGRPNLAPY